MAKVSTIKSFICAVSTACLMMLSLSCGAAASQLWCWEDGYDTLYTPGVYGTMGVTSPSNYPGVRDGAMTWTDADGKLWMMGGYGYDANHDLGYLSDVWSLNISTGNWTWEDGSCYCNVSGVYRNPVDEQGNPIIVPWYPGGRADGMTWTDSNGYLYLFGGQGIDEEGYVGDMTDMWCYDPVNFVWYFIDGYSWCDIKGTYGTKMQYDISNWPGGRQNAVMWYISAYNEIWLFGGNGFDGNGSAGNLNDVWVYSLTDNQWCWVAGSSTIEAKGMLTTKGEYNDTNTPGARSGMYAWLGNDNRLLLFGGYGLDTNGTYGYMNDLWAFDTAGISPTYQWACIDGNTVLPTGGVNLGVYGTKGIPAASNWPGGRSHGTFMTGTDGTSLYMLGGYGYGASGTAYGYLNDLWVFDTVSHNWTWYAGYDSIDNGSYSSGFGAFSDLNTPGGRMGQCAWRDANGNFWTFGGYGADAKMLRVSLNDLWELDSSTKQWAWMDGPLMQNPGGTYGVMGEVTTGTLPGSREFGATWTSPDGALWMYGGYGFDSNGDYGVLGDLWWYDPINYNWVWIGGSNLISPAYKASSPAGRFGSYSWSDPDGDLWMYGGMEHYAGGTAGFAGDLWHLNSINAAWTLIKGNRTLDAPPVYGTQVVAASNNNPGGRMRGQAWVGRDGRLWLFGGQLDQKSTPVKKGNDLWVYDPSTAMWKWVTGSSTANAAGVYGTKGVAASGNTPGARVDSCGWTDENGCLWLFGGYGYDKSGVQNASGGSDLNDLWKFDPSTSKWTWVWGSDSGSAATVAPPEEGVFTATGAPGSRSGSIGWRAVDGRFWIMGGYGPDKTGTTGWLNDYWCYDKDKGQWAHWAGSLTHGACGVYTTLGTLTNGDTPGGRAYGMGWTDGQGSLWLFGGYGLDRNGDIGVENDLWVADPVPFDIELYSADFTKGVSSALVPGAAVDFKWGVRATEAVTDPFWCEVFASKTGGFDQVRIGGTITSSYKNTAGLAANTETVLAPSSIRLNTLPDGTYTLMPCVNRQLVSEHVPERYNYLNNWAPLPYKRLHIHNTQSVTADLTFSGDVTFDINGSDERYVTVSGTVKNDGTGSSGKCWVEVFYGTLTAEATFMQQGTIAGGVNIPALNAGETQSFSITGFVPAGVDARALACIIDSTDVVPEQNETNNVRMRYNKNIIPPGKASGIDLKIMSLTLDSTQLAPTQVAPGTLLNWTVVVKNNGSKDCGNVWLELFASQTGGIDFIRSGITLTKSAYVVGPAVGETKTYTLSKAVNSIGDGMYTAVAVINRAAVSANPGDTNPLDNRMAYGAGRVSVKTAESGTANLTWVSRPTLTRNGTKIKVTGTVKNTGTTACGSFWTELWTGSFQKKTGFFYRSSIISGGQNCTGLAPGATTDISIEGTCAAGQLVGICTDITDLVPETDETDNYYYDYAP